MKSTIGCMSVCVALLLSVSNTVNAVVLGTETTYQARLDDAGVKVNGLVDMKFSLHDADVGGNMVGSAVIFDGQVGNGAPVWVTDGLLTVRPDFGASIFGGPALWLEIAVRNPHDATDTALYDTLDPRQPITATPIALQTRGIFVSDAGNVGIGTIIPSAQLQVIGAADSSAIVGQASGLGDGVEGINTATTGFVCGVAGTSASTDGAGVLGEATSPTGVSVGVVGISVSPDGVGVFGNAASTTGFDKGVWGLTASPFGVGVRGEATTTGGGIPIGVLGLTASTGGTGVSGSASATTGTTTGVNGFNASTSGKGVNGFCSANTGTTIGVQGQVTSSEGTGLFGKATRIFGTTFGVRGETASSDGVAVQGLATRTTGSTFGLVGKCESNEGTGVLGMVTSLDTFGERVGVKGEITSGQGVGVMGVAPDNSQPTKGVSGLTGSNFAGVGVEGLATADNGITWGVFGQTDSKNGIGVEGFASHPGALDFPASIGVQGCSDHFNGTGVEGIAFSTAPGLNTGVFGESHGPGGTGVLARAVGTSGQTIGLKADASLSPNGIGVVASGSTIGVDAFGDTAVNAMGGAVGVEAGGTIAVNAIGGSIGVQAQGGTFAIVSQGNLQVNGAAVITGTVTKGGGSFKIDHPLDPENRYLYHSFVESPDMMNIYNGSVVTDADGYATVELPEWFETLNHDFRYQLTAIGTFAQAIVSEEIRDRAFVVRTDQPDVKVSWQVTGIRQDPWANANRIPVEEWKSEAERGKYLHPEALGMPQELGLAYEGKLRLLEAVERHEANRADNEARRGARANRRERSVGSSVRAMRQAGNAEPANGNGDAQ